MSIESVVEQLGEQMSEGRGKRGFPRWATVLISLFLLGLVSLGATFIYVSQKADEALAVQVARVRARGEPLTTVELNDFYQPARDRPDMTVEIRTALAIFEAPALQTWGADLPIVGQGAEIPPVPGPWPQLEAVEAYLARQRTALETIRTVAGRDGTARFPVDFTAGIATLLPHVQTMRQAARVLSLQFHVHLHRGRTTDAVDCILDQIALARTLDQEPIIVAQLVRLAIAGMAIGNVQQALAHADISDANIVRIQQVLRKLDCQICVKQSLLGERAIGYTACLDPSRAEGGLPLTAAEANRLAQQHPRQVGDATKMLELNLRISEAAERSLFAALSEGDLAEAELRKLATGPWNRYSHSMTILLTPAYRQAITAFARGAAKRDTADAALAAELYRREQGQWPVSLEQLVPQFLPRIPIDSFSDQPLKIVSTAGEFKVYSVGRDGTDDHGNISDRDDPKTDTGFVLPIQRRPD